MTTKSETAENAAVEPRRAKDRRSGRNPLKTGALLAAGLVVAVWVGLLALHAWRYEKTDNAYIVGHLHQVSPQVGAQVTEVLVRDNQAVTKGQVLVKLDPTEFRNAVEKTEAALTLANAQAAQAQAAVGQAEAAAREAEARLAQAKAQIEQAEAQLALAKITADRANRLLGDSGAITQAEVDNARSGLDATTAAVRAARANLGAAEAGVLSATSSRAAASAQLAAAKANVRAAQTSLEDNQRLLAYTEIHSPADGVVGNRSVEVGNRVVIGQTLLSVAETDLWVVANFKETQLAGMAPGKEVEMTVDALPGERLQGIIESFSPASGAQFALLPPDNATGNFNKVVQRIPVKILFAKEDLARLGSRLRLGYSVEVEVRVK